MRRHYVLIGTLVALLLFGCAQPRTDLYNCIFSPHLKPDVMAEDGKKAALADDRIWYLSAESGQQGLHSMNMDGSDVRLEFAAWDIRSLTVQDGTVWTAESSEEARIFHLYERQLGTQQAPRDVLDIVDETARGSVFFNREDIWDFYMTEGRVFFRIPQLDSHDGRMSFGTYCLHQNGDLQRGFFREEEEKRFPLSSGDIVIGRWGDFIGLHTELFDYAKDRPPFSATEMCIRLTRTSAHDLIHADKNGLYFAKEEELQYVRLNPAKKILLTQFPEGEKITSFYSEEDTHLLLTRHEEIKYRTILPDKICSDKRLYRIDLKTGEREQMLSIEHPAEFVYLSDCYAATAEGETLTLYDLRGETAEAIREIELEHEIVDKANKTDCAGGWWFLYRFNEETNRDELIEKVRLY